MGIRVVTDSACDLPPSLCDERGIEVVPLTIRFGEEELVDRVELSNADFWDRMETTTILPETSAPSVGAFEETFRRLADEGADGIVCVNLSSRLSATMQSAQVASKALDGVCPVAVFDACTASMGSGSQALHAARRADDGADLATIIAELEDRRERQRLFATLDTLEFLRRGGRIGGAQAMLGSMLSIKPIITVVDGAVAPAGKVRTRSKALRFVVDQLKESDVEEICVLHSRAPDVDEFVEMLEPIVPDAAIVVGEMGPVVGVHTGPRVIGATWIERPRR
ncbi:MAG: DegV family protein [Acidimicrobiia bacterium]|nr:DegV family protein [Acidimicrobiia bacterium]